MNKLSKNLKSLAIKAKWIFRDPEYFLAPRQQSTSNTAIQDPYQIDQIFETLREELFKALNIGESIKSDPITGITQQFFAEYGLIDSGSKYFYIQPMNHKGWLVERSGLGWLVSLADKIVSKDQFMRNSEPNGISLVYEDPYLSKRTKLLHPYRIATSNDSLNHTSFTAYLKNLADQIQNTHKGDQK